MMNMDVGLEHVFWAFIVGFTIIIVSLFFVFCLHYGQSSPINFCPDACDGCVDKVILTPQDDVGACQPVWDGMDSGASPIFTGLLEQHIVRYSCNIGSSLGAIGYYEITGSYEEYFVNCHPLGWDKRVWSADYNYLYTYQIQNAVQFDYCVQEYYKQHFGGDE